MACRSLTATPCRCTLPTELRIFVPETLKACRVPPVVELLEDEELELLEELEELEELLDELELDDELLEDAPELLLDDDEELLEVVPELPPLIKPVEAFKVTRSSLAPSSRLLIRSV